MKPAALFFPILFPFFLIAGYLSLAQEAKPASITQPNDALVLPLVSTTPTGTITVTQGLSTTGTIIGAVTNGSGLPVPSDLTITLYAIENPELGSHLVFTQTTMVAFDGQYTFPKVDMTQGRSFGTFLEYAGASYGSDLATYEGLTSTFTLPITIYEATHETDALIVEQLHIFLEFPETGFVTIGELYVISNYGDRTVVPKDPNTPSLVYTLPTGAENLQFQQGYLGERYLETSDGFGDLAPVYPGTTTYEVLFVFTLPYENQMDFAQPVSFNVRSAGVLIQNTGIEFQSSQFQETGPQQSSSGEFYRSFTSDNIAAGGLLTWNLHGSPKVASTSSSTGNSRLTLVIGLAAFGAALIGAGIWLNRRNNLVAIEQHLKEKGLTKPAGEETAETLMDAIITLDEQYQAGQISAEAYQEQRATLKARLKEIMES